MKVIETQSTGETCPACGDEIEVSTAQVGEVEIICRCGCSLAVA